jgi:LysM repeat protein
MAYPGGYSDLNAARLRTVFYIAGVVIIVGCVGLGAYFLLRGVGANEQDMIPPAPAGETTTAGQAMIQADANAPAAAAAPAVMTPAAPEANPSLAGQIAQAMELLTRSPGSGPKIIEARNRLNELLPKAGGQERVFIKEQLSNLADQWLFSKFVYPEDTLCGGYKVNSGDLLSNIGKQHNVPYETLMQINGIAKPEALQAGVTIKVINGPFNAKVYRSTFTMDVYLQNTYVKSFSVGLGKPGMETPTGRWKVQAGGKLVQPVWTDPVTGRTYHKEDADYPLGSRWIALEGIEGNALNKKGFAIHGTKSPEQIGTPGSQGCIRLHNGDAIKVYDMLMQGVSMVDVVD